jgi:hypothetical protein
VRLRWLLRLAFDRKLLAGKQYAYSSEQITECGRMIGGWYKQAAAKEGAIGDLVRVKQRLERPVFATRN